MAFLFKSKKSQERSIASREGTPGSQGSVHSLRGPKDEKASGHRATPTGSLNSIENDTPNSPRRGPSIDQVQQQALQQQALQQQPQQQPTSDLPFRNGPQQLASSSSSTSSSTANSSLYPWSQRRPTYTSSHPSPFPRYGAAVNAMSSKEGDIYMMGGLINNSTVKGDLWMVEAGGSMACYPLATTAEGPGPRIGHASLLVGNAFIVYGGDSKIDDLDFLDETLYLLNTSTRQWSRALPAGPRPSGRYGHSLNILGSKIFVFGGQFENEFMNDMSAFDLNQLQMPNNRWEMLHRGEASPNLPPARTNHSMVSYNDKMYLFGGTDGLKWFNDVWCYDSTVNKWTQLDCIGYIPAPREGHAAALVDDVMYIFGGRTEEGADLGDLAAFRLPTRRWYTFQNMGPSPSPRSGHSMTTVGKSIVTFGGEPSSAASSANDLGILYVLDTTKIRYPSDSQQQQQQQQQIANAARINQGHGRRTSGTDSANGIRSAPSRDGSSGPSDQRRLMGGTPTSPPNGHRSPPPGGIDGNVQGMMGPQSSMAARSTPASSGPPPSGPIPQRPGEPSGMNRARGPSSDRSGPSSGPSPQNGSGATPPANGDATQDAEASGVQINGAAAGYVAASAAASGQVPRSGSKQEVRQVRNKGSVDSSVESTTRAPQRPLSPPQPTRQASNSMSRRSSARNSQTVVLLKELDSARNRNAWYASELELARKAGYVSTPTSSSALDGKPVETFDDEDRPLIEALLAMRSELANVQAAIDKQAATAAKQMAEVEKQRDAAVQEAVYARAKLAARQGDGSPDGALAGDEASSRAEEMSKKLSSALQLQRGLQSQLEQARADLDNERRARRLADDTMRAAQKRMGELESYKQQTSTEVERLKAELHAVQREARENMVSSADAVSALALASAERDEMARKYEEAVGDSKTHSDTFASLRAAISSSEDGRTHLQNKLEEERAHREKLESKLASLKAEHEAQTAELVISTQRLRDAEESAEKHANEARTHREAVLAGLGQITNRDEPVGGKAESERLVALQNQVAASNALVRKYQQEADAAADKLRAAEERIAGLEQYQEQSSREGVTIRRQLQSALRDTQALHATSTELKNRLAAQQLETNAMSVQHNALKDILSERGISPTSAVRARGLAGSPQTSSPDLQLQQGRLRDLESQLASSHAAHEETKQAFAVQHQESETMYREKLALLENDYRSAVHYVKGTEQMLKQLKEQLNRYKSENGALKSEIQELENRAGGSAGPAAGWEVERRSLQGKVQSLGSELSATASRLQKELDGLRAELASVSRQRDEAARLGDEAQQNLQHQLSYLEHLRSENAQLEQRASDAEQKVSLLLDQVENSVDTYRRQSRQIPSDLAVPGGGAGLGLGLGLNGSGTGEIGSARSLSPDLDMAGSSNGNSSGNNPALMASNGTGPAPDARNSAALDNLASELETLRSQWEATNKNYRLSHNFEVDAASPHAPGKGVGDGGMLTESLADWRRKLDTEDRTAVRH